jgi:hypothetical protein
MYTSLKNNYINILGLISCPRQAIPELYFLCYKLVLIEAMFLLRLITLIVLRDKERDRSVMNARDNGSTPRKYGGNMSQSISVHHML